MAEMDKRRLVSYLKNLVEFDSSSTSLEIADYVCSVLEDHGYPVKVDSRGNVISWAGKGEGFLLTPI